MTSKYGALSPPNDLITADFDYADMEKYLRGVVFEEPPWHRVDVRCDLCHNVFLHNLSTPEPEDVKGFFDRTRECLISLGYATPETTFNFWAYGPPEISKQLYLNGTQRTYDETLEKVIRTEALCKDAPYNVYLTNTVHLKMLLVYQENNVQPHNWQPNLPAGAIFAKANIKRSNIINQLIQSDANFIYSLPNRNKVSEQIEEENEVAHLWDWTSWVDPEVLDGARVDNSIIIFATGFEYPAYMYNNMSLEIVNESNDFLDQCWLSEKITRPLWAGMPWIGSPLNDQITKDLGFISYYDLMEFKIPEVNDYLGEDHFSDKYYEKFTSTVIVPATLQFQEMCKDPAFVTKVRQAIVHNQNNIGVFQTHHDKWRTHDHWGDHC